ncbi:hypothetical protein EAS54_36015 [Bradyrhizobium guangzhouense]|nr:hypothetical protein EAS54_36015 [Bradyrhizobium guangzhouense]
MIFSLALFSALTYFCEDAIAQDSSSRYGMGGQTRQFGEMRKQLSESGQPFRIEGHCQSACTMFLKMKNACVDPNAELLFHAAETPKGTQRMLNSYNGSLRSYLIANHIMETSTFTTISGRDVIRKFGYRACSPKS